VLDGTWRKSLKLLHSHPALGALPRLALAAPPPTHYRAIRKARRPDQVSTLEATCQALAQLEGDTARYAPLHEAFGRFVQRQQAMRRPPSACEAPPFTG
jgi:DTW domain-containing protein YfiP